MKLLFLILLFPFLIHGQKSNRLEKINWTGETKEVKKYGLEIKSIVPLSLCLGGVLLNQSPLKENIQANFLKPFNGYTSSLDDYIQYIPIMEMYAFDFLKIPARNNVWNQTKYLFFSELFTAGIVHLLKNTLKVQRPNNGAYTSFPSGHTSQAFVASQVLFNEYYQTNKFIGLSGYLFSGATGALRMVNNKHWLPDVVLGAGIAILVTNVVYHFEPLKNWNPWPQKKRNNTLLFTPTINVNSLGGRFVLKL